MSSSFLRVAQRIDDGLPELERAVQRAQLAWARARSTADDLYLDSVALNLHGFYDGLERLLELIAAAIDGCVPQGANWHQLLLRQMTADVPGVRPAALSDATREELEPFRGFRHVARHVYAFHLDPHRLQPLVEQSAAALRLVRRELGHFAQVLTEMGHDMGAG